MNDLIARREVAINAALFDLKNTGNIGAFNTEMQQQEQRDIDDFHQITKEKDTDCVRWDSSGHRVSQ